MYILKSFWKPLLWSAIVLGLSLMSGEKVEEISLLQIPYMDKVGHFGMYFLLTFLLLFDFKRFRNGNGSWRRVVIYSIGIAVLFGGTMELLQSIPKLHRSCDFYDFLANSSGAVMAVFLFKPIRLVMDKVLGIFTKPKQNYSL